MQRAAAACHRPTNQTCMCGGACNVQQSCAHTQTQPNQPFHWQGCLHTCPSCSLGLCCRAVAQPATRWCFRVGPRHSVRTDHEMQPTPPPTSLRPATGKAPDRPGSCVKPKSPRIHSRHRQATAQRTLPMQQYQQCHRWGTHKQPPAPKKEATAGTNSRQWPNTATDTPT
jgi:hypothetical protein